MPAMSEPEEAWSEPRIEADAGGVRLHGSWTLRSMLAELPRLKRELRQHAARADRSWDLRSVERLDSCAAVMLWQIWGARRPSDLRLKTDHERLLTRVAELPALPPARFPWPQRVIAALAQPSWQVLAHGGDGVRLLGRVALALFYLFTHPLQMPWLEVSANIRQGGTRAIGITGVVGFLIGVVLSYMSALELKYYGAESFIVSILGISIARELGPLLAAILIAGRSGSSITAQLGVMRLTQELDALSALGVSPTARLIVPRVLALAVAVPLLVVWTDIMAMLGGILAAALTLHFSFAQFASGLPASMPVFNFWFGVGKGAVFGVVIALTAAHFGLRVRPNTQSLGEETTNSVVSAITLVILVDALFAIAFNGVGLT